MNGLPNINVELSPMDQAILFNAIVYLTDLCNKTGSWDKAFFKPSDIQTLFFKLKGINSEKAQQLQAGMMTNATLNTIMQGVRNGKYDEPPPVH